MKETQRHFHQSKAYNAKHLEFNQPLSFGALDLIAPVDSKEVKQFNRQYAGLLNLLSI